MPYENFSLSDLMEELKRVNTDLQGLHEQADQKTSELEDLLSEMESRTAFDQVINRKD